MLKRKKNLASANKSRTSPTSEPNGAVLVTTETYTDVSGREFVYFTHSVTGVVSAHFVDDLERSSRSEAAARQYLREYAQRTPDQMPQPRTK